MPQRGLPRAIAICGIALFACSDTSPLPGYVPDPTLTSAAPDESRLIELPDQPGVQVPTNLAMVLLRAGEPTATAERLAGAVSGSVVGGVPEIGFHQLQLPATTLSDLDRAIETLVADPAVVSAGYDPVIEFRACPASSDVDELESPSSCAWETNELTAAVTAIEELRPSLSRVSIGLVDSGLRWRNGGFDDISVIDATAPSGRPNGLTDVIGHGTHVAGVMATDDGDGGLTGIASRALRRRLRLVVSPVSVQGSPLVVASNVVVATARATDAGARIVNLSLGLPFSNPATSSQLIARDVLVQLAEGRSHVLFVAAAANEAFELTDTNDGPAGIDLPNVITVGSHMPCAPTERAPVSSFGARVEIVAQGEQIPLIGLSSANATTVRSGTSYATPQVAAAAAILLSIDPSLSAADVKERILSSSWAGPATTSPRALSVARPVLQLLLDMGFATDVLDANGDDVSDRPGVVVGRMCGGSTYEVDGFGAHIYPPGVDMAGVLVQGNILEEGFGFVLQRTGSDRFAAVCDGCAFAMDSFGVSQDGPVLASYVLGEVSSETGGTGVAGTWTIEECEILERYPRFLAQDDTPMTVLLRSSMDGQMEISEGLADPVVVGFRGQFEVPSVVQPLASDHPTIQAIESLCEAGRSR